MFRHVRFPLIRLPIGPRTGRRAGGRDPLGPAGERVAARRLKRSGYRVLRRNLRIPLGEADLVCLDPDRRTIVVVEVKTRRLDDAGHSQRPPEAGITGAKRRKLIALTKVIARREGWERRPLRIDVVAVDWPPSGPPAVRHYRDAVRA